MNTVTSTQATKSVEKKPQQLAYAVPCLKVYGQLRDLTEAGTQGILEGAMMSNPARHV